jgi:cell division protein ZapA
MQSLIPINILVGDRTYRIKIEPKDEIAVKQFSKLINEKILEYRTHFSGKDMQDYVSMALLWFVTQQQTGEFSDTGLLKQLNLLEDIIDKKLS